MELVEGAVEIDDLDRFIAAVDGIAETHDVTIQAFDARYVAGPRHLERAVELADRAIERGENVARDRAVEILLYAAGRRQIDRALEMGVSEGENRVVVLVDAGTARDGESDGERGTAGKSGTAGEGEPCGGEKRTDAEAGAIEDLESTLEFAQAATLDSVDEKILREFFDVTDAELEATDAGIEALVCERVALLEVEK